MRKRIYLCLLILLSAITGNSYAENTRVGTTFSQVQCEYLGLDWRETYQEILEMDLDIIRIGAYWSRIEKQKDKFDFRELDWQIEKAKGKNIPILLTVGMKAPRWPEYFIPGWIKDNIDLRFGSSVSDNLIIQERVLIFIAQVVNRYKEEDIIIAWQVENEPLSRSGAQELWIRNDFLEKEIKLVRELDEKKRPIVLNAMTYPNGLLRFLTRFIYTQDPIYATIRIAQIPALNVYPAIGHRVIGKKICFWTAPRERIKYLQRFVNDAKSQGKSIWVTELQAEPWEPGDLVHTREEDAITCGAEDFIVTFHELRSLDIDTIFLWGAEYWLYRKKQYNDNTWVNAFNEIANQNDPENY